MQNLKVKTPEFIFLEESFSQWLAALNFEPSTVKYAPRKVREFFLWLEENHITKISLVTKSTIENYFEHLRTRQNHKKGGRLSKNYLRTHLTAIRKLARYLRETERESFETDVHLPGTGNKIRVIFTQQEIKALYNACGGDIYGLRDRAMLAVYYGCGLRRSEGAALNLSDILFEKDLIYVRRGKNYKERYVPMAAGVKEDLKDYADYARGILIKTHSEAFFINQYGYRQSGSAMAVSLQKLKEKAGIDKPLAGLHSLRHSVATHLLGSGMKLKQIKRFLGHSSLESTQIYTHISMIE
jgi:integrase/recombinase XerD